MAASQAKKSRSAAPPSARGVLTAAAWSEADVALAEAFQADLRVQSALAKVSRSAARAKVPTLVENAAVLELEVFALRQALARAAKQRGFSVFGAAGEEVRFDARRHRPIRGDVKRGTPVRVVVPGVAAGERILAQAEVRRVRRPES
jgi:hypothetical protein